MLKRGFIVTFFIVLFVMFPNFVGAKNNVETQNIIMFSSPTCPHCNDAKNFISNLEKEDKIELKFTDYTIANNADLVSEFYAKYEVPANYQGLVPIMFVGDKYFLGFSNTIGSEIKDYLISGEKENSTENSKKIKIPFFGEINLLNFSLPVLTVILGIVDGFNVCSLGALVLILGLVIALKSRKRIFALGGVFLITTGLVYGLMIFIWHQLFSVLAPYLRSLEVVIGILSMLGGLYLLREFYKALKSGPICSSNNILSRLAPKVENIFKNKTNWFLLISAVILFSGAVTIIEFPCSAVIPVIFSGILVEAGLSKSMALLYIALFLLFYLLDEIIVFVITVLTMKIKVVSPRFIIFFNLLAAFIFLGLGIFYLLGLSL